MNVVLGSKYGPFVRRWGAHEELANLGQAFIAINPKCFADGFEERMSDLMGYLRHMEPVSGHFTSLWKGEFDVWLQSDPEKPVLVQGDPERIHMKKVDEDGGLIYVQNQHDTNAALAEELNVTPMISKIQLLGTRESLK